MGESPEAEVTKGEFKELLEMPEMKKAILALDLDTQEALAIFELLDPDQDKAVPLEELAHGCARFARMVRSADGVPVLLGVRRILKELKNTNLLLDTRCNALV